jgi:hypothetical protein
VKGIFEPNDIGEFVVTEYDTRFVSYHCTTLDYVKWVIWHGEWTPPVI